MAEIKEIEVEEGVAEPPKRPRGNPKFVGKAEKGDHTNVTDPEGNKKKQKRKTHWSNYFMTFNSNKVFHDIRNPEFKKLEQKMIDALNDMFSEKNIEKYVIVKEAGKNFDDIKEIQFEARSEIGDDAKKLHCHALLSFHHNTLIKLNLDKLKADFGEKTGLEDGWYFNYRIAKKDCHDISKYIRKFVKGEDLEELKF